MFLEGDALREVEPGIGSEVKGGIWHPKVASCNPKKLCRTMGKIAKELGVDICLNENVVNIKYE